MLVMERAQAKTVTRLSCDEMMCPVQIAFMKSLGEIYVTGKMLYLQVKNFLFTFLKRPFGLYSGEAK